MSIIRMTSFVSWATGQGSTFSVTMKPINPKDVCVFLLLGSEPKDGSKPVDIDAAMDRAGWVRK